MKNFRQVPICLPVLAHTGNVLGDDGPAQVAGRNHGKSFREVLSSPLDQVDHDPMVVVNDLVDCRPTYALGLEKARFLWSAHTSASVSPFVLLRAPAARALVAANRFLAKYGRKIVVTDGWRSIHVQQELWAIEFQRCVGGALATDYCATIQAGRQATEMALFVPVLRNASFAVAQDALVGDERFRLAVLSLGGDVRSLAIEYLTYVANLGQSGQSGLELDYSGHTAHGNGGSADLVLVNWRSNLPVNAGVPHDSSSEVSAMDWFERHTWQDYAAAVAREPELRVNLDEHGVRQVTPHVFDRIQAERRLLFHALMAVGATPFHLESWHFNFDCSRGGKYAHLFPRGGNACQAILTDTCDPMTGEWVAIWTNRVGHELAAELLARLGREGRAARVWTPGK